MEDKPVWIIALIFVLFVMLPIGFIWSAIKQIYKNFRFRKRAVIVVGKVVEVKKIVLLPKYKSTTKFWPVFEFKNPTGDLLRGETTSAAFKYDFENQSEHEILVNFDEPETVQLRSDRIYSKAITIIAIGSVILYAGGSFMLSLN